MLNKLKEPNLHVSLKKFLCWNPNPGLIVLEDRALGKLHSREWDECPYKSSLTLSLHHVRPEQQDHHLWTCKRVFDTDSTSTLILDTEPPKVCEINVCCLSLQSMTLCYKSSNWPRQWILDLSPERRVEVNQSGVCGAGGRVVQGEANAYASVLRQQGKWPCCIKKKALWGWSTQSKGRQQWKMRWGRHQSVRPFSNSQNQELIVNPFIFILTFYFVLEYSRSGLPRWC